MGRLRWALMGGATALGRLFSPGLTALRNDDRPPAPLVPMERRWFWWGEKMLKDMAGSSAGRSFHQWETTWRRTERSLEDGALSPSEEIYVRALRAYLSLDYPALWEAWKELDAVPAYSEEVRWFTWGPRAEFYRNAAADWRWRRAAAFFQDGREAFESGRRDAAADLFKQALGQQPGHFLAERFLRLSLMNRKRDVPERRRERPAEVAAFHGASEERLAKGEESFRAGRWFESLAWFESVSGPGHPPEPRVRAERAAKRLAWMFPDGNGEKWEVRGGK